jgi:uncharacterized protein YoxC
MSGGDVAALIAAGGFVLLVLFIAVPLLKLGRVLDETRNSIRDLNETVSPLLSELTGTVTATNKQLAKVDQITENISEVTTLGSPLVKIAGLTQGLRSALLGKKK